MRSRQTYYGEVGCVRHELQETKDRQSTNDVARRTSHPYHPKQGGFDSQNVTLQKTGRKRWAQRVVRLVKNTKSLAP